MLIDTELQFLFLQSVGKEKTFSGNKWCIFNSTAETQHILCTNMWCTQWESRSFWLAVNSTETFWEREGPLEEEQQKKPGAGSSHTGAMWSFLLCLSVSFSLDSLSCWRAEIHKHLPANTSSLYSYTHGCTYTNTRRAGQRLLLTVFPSSPSHFSPITYFWC